MDQQAEVLLSGGGRSKVSRAGDVVYRPTAQWSSTTVALLRHLERVGYPYSPRVVDEGFDRSGREMLHTWKAWHIPKRGLTALSQKSVKC